MYIADLHIHSKYSRATSRDCDAAHLDLWARYKGIHLVGTGDFTHPAWREELGRALVPAEEGFYRLREEYALPARIAGAQVAPRFVVSGEISTIYKKDGRTRKVHHLILLPGLEAAEQLSLRLEAIGNLRSDGRPILGLDSRDLLEIVLESCPEAIYIPAHIWTPHFSLFGAFSGFDTIEACYGDLSDQVRTLETGLSSDPPMNRRLSALDGRVLVSNSDAHSPGKLGREANLLTCEMGYPALRRALRGEGGLSGTIEFFPEEGKYHLDGHRGCDVCLAPEETRRLDGRCPICGRKLTIGVLNRVEEMADRPEGFRREEDNSFESLMPLPELLADCMGVSPASKRVQEAYFALLARLGSEFCILREVSPEDAGKAAGFAVAEALRRLRAGKVIRRAGYDGEYGTISLFAPHELKMLGGQTAFLDMTAARKAPRRSLPPREKPPEPEEGAKPEATHLNARQMEAVSSQSRAIAVVAGPGTGKTGTLVERVAHLIEGGTPPSRITAVTFTRQAAGEMRARLGGKKAIRGLTVDTFHAICLKLLDEKPILSRVQALKVAREALREMGQTMPPADALRAISREKSGAEPALPGLREAYDTRLNQLGARDLDDVLLDALRVDTRERRMFDQLLVDEFQDINAVQRQLVCKWSEGGSGLFVIGDPDQSIYGFRGASAACFAELAAARPELATIFLTENYRSSAQVVESALSVIGHNPGPERLLHANRPEGARVRVVRAPDPFSEGVWIAGEIARMAGGVDMLQARGDRAVTRAFSEIAVLCRTRRQLEQIENCLRHDSIPCMVSGREDFLADESVQGMLGFFRSLLDARDRASLGCALTALFHCDEEEAQRVARANGGAEDLEESGAAGCYLAAVHAFAPKVRREKPRKLLEELARATGARGASVEKLLSAALFFTDMPSFLQALLLGEEDDIRRVSGGGYASGAVRLMTLHGAKGLEFPVVFLAGADAGTLPLQRADRPADPEEERRLFFVGITRAREELIVSCGVSPSAFLDELGQNVSCQTIRARRQAPQVEQLRLF